MVEDLLSKCDEIINVDKSILKVERCKFIKSILLDKAKITELSIEDVYGFLRDLGYRREEFADCYKRIVLEQ